MPTSGANAVDGHTLPSPADVYTRIQEEDSKLAGKDGLELYHNELYVQAIDRMKHERPDQWCLEAQLLPSNLYPRTTEAIAAFTKALSHIASQLGNEYDVRTWVDNKRLPTLRWGFKPAFLERRKLEEQHQKLTEQLYGTKAAQ